MGHGEGAVPGRREEDHPEVRYSPEEGQEGRAKTWLVVMVMTLCSTRL